MKKTRNAGTLLGIFTAVLFLTATLPGTMAAQEPSVSAAGAVVMDFDTGEFYYEKNADLPRPVASMTKLMSLYLVFEEMEAGNLSPDGYVTAGARAAAISNNSLYSGLERLRAGENYRVEDLLRIIMTKSCNGSVLALAEHIGETEEAFVERMNETAARLGLNAHFADSFGFKDDGNAVSPRAMALLAQRIIADYPQILDYSSLPEATFQDRSFLSTNTLLREGMVEGIDGLKTGTTDGAGYCFTGTAQREGRRIISVVMGAANHTARMLESQSLLEYGFACRQIREGAWRAIGESLHADITAQGPLWARTEATFTATLSGLTAEAGGQIHWEVAGLPVEGSEGPLWLMNGATAEATVLVPAGEGPLPVALIVTLPDGTVLRQEEELSLEENSLTFTGRMGARRLELYPEASLRIPFQVRCDQEVFSVIPAGWYLDGEPIPLFQNAAFRVGPECRTSGYNLTGEELTPGEHLLEFRLNPEGLPGVEQASFPLEILILDEEGSALPQNPEPNAA